MIIMSFLFMEKRPAVLARPSSGGLAAGCASARGRLRQHAPPRGGAAPTIPTDENLGF